MEEPTPTPLIDVLEMHVTPAGLHVEARSEMFLVISNYFVEQFRAENGVNYVVWEMTHDDLGPFTLTMQRAMGEQPHRQVAQLRTDMDRMLVVIGAALDALETDNDPASAARVLRTCLRKFGRLPG